MTRSDLSFTLPDDALQFLSRISSSFQPTPGAEKVIPSALPDTGIGEDAALNLLAPAVLGGACDLGAETFFAHMNPPTPWITWVATFWNAALNQNLLHPDTSPVAHKIEELVIEWLAPIYGATGGQLVPGATLANLTALWAARERRGITEVVTSSDAHLSIRKAAHILGLSYREIPVDAGRRLDPDHAGDLSTAALVLTAGTTATGAIDPIHRKWDAAWLHIDAAWSGPLRLSSKHKHLLDGIEQADSVTVSAHKWFFQPKESALVFFQDFAAAGKALSFSGSYLVTPNIGLLGSHGATAIPLLATLLAWGRSGLEQRLDTCMQTAEDFANLVEADSNLILHSRPVTGIVLWRPRNLSVEELAPALTEISVSTVTTDGTLWFRCVAANPMLNVEKYYNAIQRALNQAR